jgi:6-phosphogluconolactonase
MLSISLRNTIFIPSELSRSDYHRTRFVTTETSAQKRSRNNINQRRASVVRTTRMSSEQRGERRDNDNKNSRPDNDFMTKERPEGAPKCTIYYTARLVAKALADLTRKRAKESIDERGFFALAIAGGSLIKMLQSLKDDDDDDEKDNKNKIEWEKWHVFWVDERCVKLEDEESNFGGANETLFKHVNIPRENLHAIDDSLFEENKGASEPAAKAYDNMLKSLSKDILPRDNQNNLPIFDLLLLGFGPDGHICSLFPNHELVKVNDDRWILPIADSPKPPPERITFSLPVVNNAKQKVFAVVGEGKAEMAKHILEDANKTNGSIPAAMVEDAEWIFDVDGSSKLTWTHVKFELPGTPTLLGLDTDKKEEERR